MNSLQESFFAVAKIAIPKNTTAKDLIFLRQLSVDWSIFKGQTDIILVLI